MISSKREEGTEWLPESWGRTRHLSFNQPLGGRLGTGTAARGNPGTRRPRVVGGVNPPDITIWEQDSLPLLEAGKTKRPVRGTTREGLSPPWGDAGESPLTVITLLGLLALGKLCL